MANTTRKTERARHGSSNARGRAITYRGVKVISMTGKRSATARAIRDALRAEHRRLGGKAAHD